MRMPLVYAAEQSKTFSRVSTGLRVQVTEIKNSRRNRMTRNHALSETAQDVLELIENSGGINQAKQYLEECDYELFEAGLFELLRAGYLVMEKDYEHQEHTN